MVFAAGVLSVGLAVFCSGSCGAGALLIDLAASFSGSCRAPVLLIDLAASFSGSCGGTHTVDRSCCILFWVLWPDVGVLGSWLLPVC